MKLEDLKIGRCYRAKQPRQAGFGYVNDRQIIWIGMTEVQYDSPAVEQGERYPKIDTAKFLAWAGRDVTEELPPSSWQTWRDYVTKLMGVKRKETA